MNADTNTLPSASGPGLLPITAALAAGCACVVAGFVAVQRALPDMPRAAAGLLALALFETAFLAALALLERYNSADWQVPSGTEQSNWGLRHRVSLALGVISVALSALCATLFIHDVLLRGLLLTQSALMAVAAANDFRRFRLPLPVTLCGLAVAALALAVGPFTPLVIGIALLWAILVCFALVFVARSGMSLGDYIALFWIALAAPFNGLLAVLFGQLGLDILGCLTGWKAARKRVPVGGAWLIVAAALLAAPQWPGLILGANADGPVMAQSDLVSARPDATAVPVETATATPDGAATATPEPRWPHEPAFKSGQATRAGLLLARSVAAQAGGLTGLVGFEPDRETRMRAARAAARQIAALRPQALAATVSPAAGAALAQALGELSLALGAYDVEGVRSASLSLTEQRASFDALLREFDDWRAAATPQARPAETPDASQK